MAGPPASASTSGVTWVARDALPEVEGAPLKADRQQYTTIEEMREWCEQNPEACGFAYHPPSEELKSWGFYPKRTNSGFEAGVAKWRTNKHSGEKWQFHYIVERSGPQELDALPELLADSQLPDCRLSKQILEYGTPDTDATPKASDTVVYRVLEIRLNGHQVPGVTGETCQVTLGVGHICEALEFGLAKMRVGERARLKTTWALLSAKPPPPAEAAEALLDGAARDAELVVELVSFESGEETTILEAMDAPDDGTISEAESRDRRLQQVEALIDCAKAIKDSGTELFKAQRLLMALARYNGVCELLMMLDMEAKLEVDPMMTIMGMKDSHIREGQQFLHKVLGEKITSEAKAVLVAARLNMAQCWLNLRHWSKATSACDEVLRSDPASVKAHYRRAQAKMALKDWQAARKSLQELLRHEPDNPAAKKLLNEATQKLKHEEEVDKQRMKKAVMAAAQEGALDSKGRTKKKKRRRPKGEITTLADALACQECDDDSDGEEDEGAETDEEDRLGNLGMLSMANEGISPGMSPLDVARKMGNKEVIDVMETHMEKKRIEDIMEEYDVSREEAIQIRDRGGL